MPAVGARPDELRRLATVLLRAIDDVAWLRRRVDDAQSRARVRAADAPVLSRLEVWLADGAIDLRRRAGRLEDGWVARGGLMDDFRPPVVSVGGCGTVHLPLVGRGTEPDGLSTPLGEPLFASAALSCMPVARPVGEGGLQLIVAPDGTLVLASRGKKGGGAGGGSGGGGGGGPKPPKPTKEEVLDKLRLPHGDEAEFKFVPPKSWHPGQPMEWDPKHRGYVDAKRDVWRKGPSRTPGDPFEWDVQLKKGSGGTGSSKDGKHLNIDLRGKISH